MVYIALGALLSMWIMITTWMIAGERQSTLSKIYYYKALIKF